MNKEVEQEILRFIRICAMRHGVKQDDVIEHIKTMMF